MHMDISMPILHKFRQQNVSNGISYTAHPCLCQHNNGQPRQQRANPKHNTLNINCPLTPIGFHPTIPSGCV
jgi:hypothetical protein